MKRSSVRNNKSMTMLVLYLLVLCASALAHVRPPPDLYDLEDAENIFEEFINKYNKVYASEQEKQERFNIFKDNLKEINELRLSEKGKQTSHGINILTDWSKEEFQSLLGLRPGQISLELESVNMTMDLPERFDWRESNVITEVKDQGRCKVCWTFSTTGAIEGAYAIKNQQLLSFSEQQLVDCERGGLENGCNHGGWPRDALNYLQSVGGIMLELDYPYENADDQCRFDQSKVAARIVGQKAFDLSDVTATKQALVQYGPISITVCATSWNSYPGGIRNCVEDCTDHAVLLVGYGTENGVPYWLIKNSWGPNWGENGYIRIQQGNGDNHVCGMADFPGVVPVLA